MSIWLALLGLAVGLAVLAWSADVFVDGSASLARRCGLSPLLVGMVVIGFGTSLPELMVSLLSALEGNPCISLGNAYGSNIANIGLILGLTAAICPITVASGVLNRELPVLLGITLVCGGLLANGVISRVDAIVMLVLFFAFLANNIIVEKRRERTCPDSAVAAPEASSCDSLGRASAKVLAGLALVIGSSQLLVKCAVKIAAALGVPDLIVGLTIVAVGTSLPELASSLAAIRKREHDLALGNIVGSNFFNTLAVVGLAGVVKPMTLGDDATSIHMVLVRDYPVMIAVTVVLLLFCIPFCRGYKARINRVEGAFLLLVYVAYLGLLVAGQGLFAK